MRWKYLVGLWQGAQFHTIQLAIWLICWNMITSLIGMETPAASRCSSLMWMCWMPCYALVFGIYNQWVQQADFTRFLYFPYVIYLIISCLILFLEIQATEARIDFSSIFIEILAPLFGGLCWFIQQRIRQCLSFSPWLIKIMGWFISLITVLVMCDWLLVLYKLLIQNYL